MNDLFQLINEWNVAGWLLCSWECYSRASYQNEEDTARPGSTLIKLPISARSSIEILSAWLSIDIRSGKNGIRFLRSPGKRTARGKSEDLPWKALEGLRNKRLQRSLDRPTWRFNRKYMSRPLMERSFSGKYCGVKLEKQLITWGRCNQ